MRTTQKSGKRPAKLSLEQLKVAIRENQLVLFYQPKLNITTNKVTGFEALVRLRHPELGLIFPDQFIPALRKRE